MNYIDKDIKEFYDISGHSSIRIQTSCLRDLRSGRIEDSVIILSTKDEMTESDKEIVLAISIDDAVELASAIMSKVDESRKLMSNLKTYNNGK